MEKIYKMTTFNEDGRTYEFKMKGGTDVEQNELMAALIKAIDDAYYKNGVTLIGCNNTEKVRAIHSNERGDWDR